MDATNKVESGREDMREAGLGDSLLDDLRAIVAGPDRVRLMELEARMAAVEHRTGDHEALVASISPILGDAIRKQVREDREAMVESLYPLIGQLISRAVAESIRDLVRIIDRRMRTSFSVAYLLRRLKARAAGVSEAELAMRDALPFQVTELFLVHRESGLLLLHLSNELAGSPGREDDSDLVSGMLTAVRDFAHDAFGRGQDGQLDEIQYGTRRILIEACQHVYLAVVVEGIEPVGFRARLRERTIEVENRFNEALRLYDGDASRFAPVRPAMHELLAAGWADRASSGLSRSQKRILIALAAALMLCLGGACFGTVAFGRSALSRPAYYIVVTATPGPTATSTPTAAPTATWTASPTATHTATPTATATGTWTATPTATYTWTPTATFTSTSTATATATSQSAPLARVTVFSNVRVGPGLDWPIAENYAAGKVFTLVGRDPSGRWFQVCCTRGGLNAWIQADLVSVTGSVEDIPVVQGR